MIQRKGKIETVSGLIWDCCTDGEIFMPKDREFVLLLRRLAIHPSLH